MRSLAGSLGVAPMALYRHAAASSVRPRGAGAASLGGPPLGVTHEPGPANLRHHEAVLAVLLGAGFSSATATHAYNLLDSYIYGFVLQETNLPFSDADELADVGQAMLEHMPADEYPNLVKVAGELIVSGFDYASEFEYGLDLLLDAIEGSHAAI